MKRLKKGTPGKGGDSPRDAFSQVPVGHGLKNVWFGWLAGEPYWCKAHEHKPPVAIGTKPCLTWLTDGELHCPRCKPRVLPTWIGWVPVYRELDQKPCLVIVHESVMDLLTGLRYGTRVQVGRASDTSSIYVRRAEDQRPVFKSEHEQRQQSRDITPDLLVMWGYPILNEWMRRGAEASDNAVSLKQDQAVPPAPTKPDVRPYTPPAPDDDQGGGDRGGDGGVGSAKPAGYDAVLDRIKNKTGRLKPSANGNGKHDS